MGVLMRYFVAESDELAAAELTADSLPGIDGPDVVALLQLEVLVTGTAFNDLLGRPRCFDLVASDESGAVVTTVAPETQQLLAGLDAERIAALVPAWSATEELDGAEPARLADVLSDMASLAAESSRRGHQLYCLVAP